MGEVIKLKLLPLKPPFENIPAMLNQWWKELERKPFGVRPVRIRHLVETAHAAGWTIDECYEALSTTWAFTEAAFETALRRLAEEGEARQSHHSNVTTVDATRKALELNKKEALSIDENVKRLQELRRSKK